MEILVPKQVNNIKVKKEYVSRPQFLQMRSQGRGDSVHGDSKCAK
jgi:hypothetical protein